MAAKSRNSADEQSKEAWRNFTTAGKVFNILFLCALIIAAGVFFLASIEAGMLSESSRNYAWIVTALSSSSLHVISLPALMVCMVKQRNRLGPEKWKKLDRHVSPLYVCFLTCLWLVSGLVGANARPSCDPGSDWWKETADVIDMRLPGIGMTLTCHIGVVVVALSIINALILFTILMASLVTPFNKDEHNPPLRRLFLRIMAFGPGNESEQDAETLLDKLTA